MQIRIKCQRNYALNACKTNFVAIDSTKQSLIGLDLFPDDSSHLSRHCLLYDNRLIVYDIGFFFIKLNITSEQMEY